jgi:hypothetical protein
VEAASFALRQAWEVWVIAPVVKDIFEATETAQATTAKNHAKCAKDVLRGLYDMPMQLAVCSGSEET